MSTTQNELLNTNASTAPEKPVSLWRNRDYLLLWSGQTISTMGTAMSQLAFPLLILALTKSPALAGFAGALNSVPYLFLSLPVGALIDRWDRKKVMIICDTVRALNMASIPLALLLGHPTLLQLYVNSLVEGVCFVFFNIAEAAALPQVVPEEQIAAAVGQNEATIGASNLLGSLVSGAVFAVSRLLPFLADALSYAVSVVSLLFIGRQFQEERDEEETSSLSARIIEGLRWLWNQPVIRFMAFLTGGINFVFAGLGLTIIVLAQRQHASPAVIGLIFTIGGIGGIVGSLLGNPLQKRLSFGQVIVGSVWLMAILWPLYMLVPNFWLLGLVSALFFLVVPIYNVMQISYRLTLIPDQLQGRVNSVYRLVAFGFQPLGLAGIGLLIQFIGVIQTVCILSIYLLLLAVLATLNGSLRNARATAAKKE